MFYRQVQCSINQILFVTCLYSNLSFSILNIGEICYWSIKYECKGFVCVMMLMLILCNVIQPYHDVCIWWEWPVSPAALFPHKTLVWGQYPLLPLVTGHGRTMLTLHCVTCKTKDADIEKCKICQNSFQQNIEIPLQNIDMLILIFSEVFFCIFKLFTST